MPDLKKIKFQELYTERLELRHPSLDGINEVYRISNLGEVQRYAGWSKPSKELLIKNTGDSILEYTGLTRSLVWNVYFKNSTRLIGWVNIFCTILNNPHQAYIGYVFDPEFWGHGYATESVRAIINFAFASDLELTSLRFSIFEQNEPSRKLAERVGAKLVGIVPEGWNIDGNVSNECIYIILKSDIN